MSSNPSNYQKSNYNCMQLKAGSLSGFIYFNVILSMFGLSLFTSGIYYRSCPTSANNGDASTTYESLRFICVPNFKKKSDEFGAHCGDAESVSGDSKSVTLQRGDYQRRGDYWHTVTISDYCGNYRGDNRWILRRLLDTCRWHRVMCQWRRVSDASATISDSSATCHWRNYQWRI